MTQKNIIRSKKQIASLIDAIKTEIETLPKLDAWGSSNDDDRAEMREWVDELERALKSDTADDYSEAGHWLTSKQGILGADFGVV